MRYVLKKISLEKTILETIDQNLEHVQKLKETSISKIASAAQIIVDSLKNGGCVYLCGNGGSAADCQHIAGEIVGRFRKERKAYAAVALTADASVLTCIANDYGYDDVFRRQLEGLAQKGDILWAFSTSGNSLSVIKAAKLAKEMGVKVIGFTGKSPNELETLCDVYVSANCLVTSTSQEVHMLAYHIICDLVEQKLSE